MLPGFRKAAPLLAPPESGPDGPRPARVGAPRKQPFILIVEDDGTIRSLLGILLKREGYRVTGTGSGDHALDWAVDHAPDLVVLDLALPGTDGLEICRELRAWLPAPILVVSGRGDEAAKIAALDLGADDYVTKPFGAGELLARVRALLRRRAPAPGAEETVVCAGGLRLDLVQRRVWRRGREVRLTRIEFDLLARLARGAGRVVKSSALVEAVWGSAYAAEGQTLRVHVANLRRKIEPDPDAPTYVLTWRGVGYWLGAARNWPTVAAGSLPTSGPRTPGRGARRPSLAPVASPVAEGCCAAGPAAASPASPAPQCSARRAATPRGAPESYPPASHSRF